ncbi:MAG: FtsQ-type POTRA domain-containing protein [Firmicutes bacterium]|nr:FtsQ-type POTRA domain-containing protein [Bacillota bacterium]
MAERDDLFLEEVDEDVYLMASHEEIPEYNETETDASGSDEVAAEPLPTLESDAAETWPAQEEPHLDEERSEPKAEEESVESAAFPIQPEDDLDDFLEGVDELEELDSMSELPEEQASEASEEAPKDQTAAKERARILAVDKWRTFKSKLDSESNDHWKAWAVIGAMLILVVIILNSDIFALKSYEVEGNERVSSEAIMNDLGLTEGTNLFRYALSHLNSTPSVDSRLSTVDVYFRWPSHVRVVVEESQTIGYVYFQGTYLCIDRKGQVAATTDSPDEDLPIITGLVIKSFSIGESLNTNDFERYDAVVSIGANLRKYELERLVNEINVRSLDDIVLKTDHMEIRVGSMTDIEQKISITASVLSQKGLPDGTLHIESLSDQIYIEPKEIESEIGK